MTEEGLALLHSIRVKGMLRAEAVDRQEADRLAELEREGLVVSSPAGFSLAPEGQSRHLEWLDREREKLDLEGLATYYERFLAVNAPVKQLCARWQELDAEDGYARAEALAELEELHQRVEPVLRRSARKVPRFGEYLERLGNALERAREGDGRWVTDPTIDSYHSIWFECHEDYLLTLGRDRESEGS